MMKLLRLCIVLILFASGIVPRPIRAVAAPTGGTLYVAPGAPSTAACTRADPCDFRYAAEIVANDGDTIYARSGTYTAPTPGSVHLLYIHKSLTIYGSCTFDAATPVTCDPTAQDSYLDGETNKRVITIDGLGVEEVQIEGFTIMRGNADGVGAGTCVSGYVSGLSGCGGGIFAENLAKLTLRNNYIWANKGGTSGGLGGGLYAETVDRLELVDNTLIFNFAANTGRGMGGGAFVVSSGDPNGVLFTGNEIHGNEISTDDHSGLGAGLMLSESMDVVVRDNLFHHQNVIGERVMEGVSIFAADTSGVSIEKNRFWNEWGFSMVQIDGREGAVSDAVISRNLMVANPVARHLSLIGPLSAKVVNNFIGDDLTTRGGGTTAVYIRGDAMGGDAVVDVQFNTIVGVNFGVQVANYTEVGVNDNILTKCTTVAIDLSTLPDVDVTVGRNLFYENSTDGALGSDPVDADPLLADPLNGDYHLLPGSGAIDQAVAVDMTIDIDGLPRPVGLSATPYDLGADEFAHSICLAFVLK
jgi:hypothetical protein